MGIVRGAKIEERMRRFFKGVCNPHNEIDFETSTSVYEVKSCKLFNRCFNANNLRPFKSIPHKKCVTQQLGRFQIKTDNHIMLYLRSIQLNKFAKYIFVLIIGNQIAFKVLPWKSVYLPNTREYHYLNIRDIFYEEVNWDENNQF